MKMKWLVVIGAIIVLGVVVSRFIAHGPNETVPHKEANSTVDTSYWTCPMHPEIHSDKPGECPICHMKLVQVKPQGAKAESHAGHNANRADVHVSEAQMALLGIQKHKVEKMDLVVRLPISGRFLSSTAVAFQIYENDLRYVKPGLTFKGESGFFPDEEVLGTISTVDSIVDPTSRTVRAVGSVKKGPRGLFSETSFRGEVDIELKDRVAIPESSVLHTGSGDIVYVFGEGNRLSAKTIKLGPKTESFYEVLEGLKPGDEISSGPNFLIDSEAKIRGTQSAGKNGQAHH